MFIIIKFSSKYNINIVQNIIIISNISIGNSGVGGV